MSQSLYNPETEIFNESPQVVFSELSQSQRDQAQEQQESVIEAAREQISE